MRRLALLACIGLFAIATPGCARDASPVEPSGTDEADTALTADFMRAYSAGLASVDAGAADTTLAGVDHDFARGHGEILRTPLTDVATLIASGEADALLQARYAALGLTPDTLQSANLLLFVAGWEAVNGERAAPEAVQGLARQMATRTGTGNAAGDPVQARRQQRILELLSAAIMHEARRLEASANATDLARFREAIREDFQRQSGNDLARFDLTAEGFVPR